MAARKGQPTASQPKGHQKSEPPAALVKVAGGPLATAY
jgi:hypothetical protein